METLHWFPCEVRHEGPVAQLQGFKWFHISLLHLYVPSRALRSQDTGLVKVPKARRKTVGSCFLFFACLACCVELFKANSVFPGSYGCLNWVVFVDLFYLQTARCLKELYKYSRYYY